MALSNTLLTDTGSGGTNTTATSYTALRYGSKGSQVITLQKALAAAGLYTGAIDGSYGPKTLAAVKAYQKANNLTVDGIAGPKTQTSLYSTKPATTQPTTTTVKPATTTTTTPVQQTGIPAVGVPLPEDIARMQGVQTGAVSAAQFDQQMQAIRDKQAATPVTTVPQTGVPIGGTPLPEDIARMQGVQTQTPTPTTPVPGAPLPEDVERRKAELAGEVPLQVDKTIQEQQQVKTDLDNIVAGTIGTGTGTGGTGGTRTSGTTPTGGGTTTTGGTSTTGGTGTGTGTGEQSATGNWQEYFKKATETQFQYNPAQDQEYLRAASVLEQQVTDMMVGRGGLYSSVAHAALQSRLMSLQVDYQKMAYEKFKEERDYNMKLAAFLADREDVQWDKDFKTMQFKASREDEEWNRSFKMAQFQADHEQRKFDNSIKTAQLRISQANAAANRAMADAKAKQAAAANKLANMRVEFEMDYDKNEEMINRWRKIGSADYEIASYFNVPLGAEPSGTYGNRIEQSIFSFETRAQQIVDYAQSLGDAQTTLDTYNSFREEAPAVDYQSAYNEVYTDIAKERQKGTTYEEIRGDFLRGANYYKSVLDVKGYRNILEYLNKQADSEQ